MFKEKMKLGDKIKKGTIKIIYYENNNSEIIIKPYKGGNWISKKIKKNNDQLKLKL